MNKLFQKNSIAVFIRGTVILSLLFGFPVAVFWAMTADTLWPYYVYLAFIVIFPVYEIARQPHTVKRQTLANKTQKSEGQPFSFKESKKYKRAFYS
ncbi:hypothetical protein [Thalassomonas actiniarum]|uniref:Uncharacterized protein n=1 Tax=Thalassomonas actiniarum TaxID=485447 RepID=A0AAE9YWE8_9GAMM|nr:hypothetical protein [Thalassomonas actiniarum]WDE02410.1 hypothetical protein SG35_028780 [Thalassomonas actiniarum]